MTENAQIIMTLIVCVTSLLTWLIHKVISYFITSANSKMLYIETLVGTNQKNTDSFVGAINHQQTLNREMQQKTVDAINNLEQTIQQNNRINEKVMSIIAKS